MRKTKIVCTLGPATDDPAVLEAMIDEGMNVARFNFSHSNYEEHLKRLSMLKEAREKKHKYIAALLDTKGPEIRVCKFKDGKIMLETGKEFTLTTRDVEGDESIVSVTYKDFPSDVSIGTRVLIDDGLIELKVIEKNDTDVKCVVINPGPVSDNKGVNLPGTVVSMPYMSEKDIADINFAVDNDFDFIAASFARTAGDILKIRRILDERNCSSISIIAKIENKQGVENIDEILQVSDGVMIARGDMGVEIPYEDVPVIQKMIIKKALKAGKVTITATQMLDSMIKNPRPTRAEVTDVANAVYDGTDVVMLSGETAMGKYPVEALKVMVKIVEETEHYLDYNSFRQRKISKDNKRNVANVVCNAAVLAASTLNAKAIIAPSFSGFTTMMLSKWKPEALVIGTSPNKEIVRQMQMYWGIIPMYEKKEMTTESLIDSAVDMLKGKDILRTDDTAVVIAGIVNKNSEERAGSTNLMKIITVK